MAVGRPQRFADDFIFLEAPRWHAGELWVSDVFDHRVYALALDGSRRQVCEVPHRPSGLGFLPDGTLIVVSSKDRKLLRVEDGSTTVYADLSGHASGDVNDFAIDSLGRVYVGNFGYDYDAGEPRKTTALHRVDPDGAIRTAAEGVEFPNGSVFINDGRTLVVAETWLSRLTAFDVDERGELSNRQVFADLGRSEPDGIWPDAEGAIWVACFNTGEFLRVLDGGKVTDRLQFEGRSVSCTLGGEDGRQLFCSVYAGSVDEIVARKRLGTLFTVTVDTPGRDSDR
jgi:sugar lactone lactonase YvrE